MITADLRSDTLTKPTAGMLEAMMNARVGDDVFGEDPMVNELEKKAAAIFGKDAALFCPTGTMTNQIAINIMTSPRDEVICDKTAHIYNFEAGGMAFNSGVSAKLLDGDRGRFSAKDVLENINPGNDHYAQTSLVSIENTSNRGGGSFYSKKQMEEIFNVCKENKLGFHLDGARIFNALAVTGDNPVEIGKLFDTISICLSKGLGAPAGSLVISDHEKIRRARRVRKVFGGGMRQAGFIAAAGIFALDHHIERLKEDHKRAVKIAEVLASVPFVKEVLPCDTNIVICNLTQEKTADEFVKQLAEKNIKVLKTAKHTVRLVTHLDFDDRMLEYTLEILKSLKIKTKTVH